MFNCTWESENGPAKFFLGASLTDGSFDSFQPAVGTWKPVVRRARYGLTEREVLSLAGWRRHYIQPRDLPYNVLPIKI